MEEKNSLIVKNVEILKTKEDMYGHDIYKMSDFSCDIRTFIEAGEYFRMKFSLDVSDFTSIGEALKAGTILFKNNTLLVPDMDSLPEEVKKKIADGDYALGESSQVDGNWRAVIVDLKNHNQRVKDVTLKEIKNTEGLTETIRSISVALQFKQLSNQINVVQQLQVFQLDKQRDDNIKAPFLDARQDILNAQRANTDEKKIVLSEAS